VAALSGFSCASLGGLACGYALALPVGHINAPDRAGLPALQLNALELEKAKHLAAADGCDPGHSGLAGAREGRVPPPQVSHGVGEVSRVDALFWHLAPELSYHLQRLAQRLAVLAHRTEPEFVFGPVQQIGYGVFIKFAASHDASRIWSANGGWRRTSS
jgi:hypothetical protein